MAKGLLIAALDFSNVAEDEFNDWYDLRAHPRAAAGTGVFVAASAGSAPPTRSNRSRPTISPIRRYWRARPIARSAAKTCRRGRSG